MKCKEDFKMNKLIGFNLIQIVVWFIIVMLGTSKTNDWKHFYSNWIILSILTAVVSSGIYYWFK